MITWELEERRDNRGSVVGKSWRFKSGSIYASIVSGHIYYPDGFVMHCKKFDIDTKELKAKTIDDAMHEAEQILYKYAVILRNDLESILDME